MNEKLPILDIIEDLKNALFSSNTVILQAPPGAGKSTLLPLQLLNETWLKNNKIILLEPRRLAAKTVASRMAQLLNEEVGNTVGYRIRFETKVSSFTKIEVVTEGIFIRMLQQDNSLEGIGIVLFDEFHERSLNSDLALALTREAQQIVREDLRLLIMSATLDSEKLSGLLNKAPVISSQGKQYPVELIYQQPDPTVPFKQQMVRLIKKAFNSTDGDLLVFLPGTGDIHTIIELLSPELMNVNILPLYGELPVVKQQEAILPSTNGKRKIILATSIAETSLTIQGIKVVVDSGLSRVPKFDPRSGLTKLETVKVTKDSADQRAGRAGRLGPGTCYRLWSEGSHQHLIDNRIPEIQEADLASMMLELFGWGVNSVESLSWLTPPPQGACAQASQLLQNLEAVENNKITDKGKQMLRLPTHPRIAHILLEADNPETQALATDLAALLEEKDPLKKESGANIALRIEALRQWRKKEYTLGDKNTLERIERVANSWRTIFKLSIVNNTISQEEIGLLISKAYPERIAKQRENNYKLSNGRTARLKEDDPLAVEPWLAIASMDAGIGDGKIYLAAPLALKDILPLAKNKTNIRWDKAKGVIVAREELRIGDLVLQQKNIESISEEEKNELLCEVIKEEGLKLLNTDKAEELQNRISSIRQWRSEEQWPDVSDNYLLATIEEWLPIYLGPVRKKEDFKKISLSEIIFSLIPYELQSKLDYLAPEKIKVPSGSMVKINYSSDGSSPILAVRLQELFGLPETPAVNDNKIKITIHLLSPAFRPVQVTQDLKSFWHNTYPDVRKELRIRYPKHSWPEDPWTAEAIRGVKRNK